jgi:hypothetical protein
LTSTLVSVLTANWNTGSIPLPSFLEDVATSAHRFGMNRAANGCIYIQQTQTMYTELDLRRDLALGSATTIIWIRAPSKTKLSSLCDEVARILRLHMNEFFFQAAQGFQMTRRPGGFIAQMTVSLKEEQ